MDPLLYYLKGYGIHIQKKGQDTFNGLGDYKFIKLVIISKSNKEILLEFEEPINASIYCLDNLKKASDNLNKLYGFELLVVEGVQENKNGITP